MDRKRKAGILEAGFAVLDVCRDRKEWTKKICKEVPTHTESSDWNRVTIPSFYSILSRCGMSPTGS
jgi:hypothetical protein